MSDSPRPAPRPTRVTFASVLGTAGCAVLVLSLFDTLARLNGTDTREEVADTLAEPPFRGSGVTVDQVLTGLRALGYTAGALAAAGVVLAVFVALRHRGARIGFTVVAGLLVLTMPTTGMLPVLPAVAAGMLWRRDARDWFAGRAPEPPQRTPSPAPSAQPPREEASRQPWVTPPTPTAPPASPAASSSAPPPASSPYATPPAASAPQAPPSDPWSQPAQHPAAQPARPEQPAWVQGPPPSGGAAPSGPGRRPGTVTTAAVLALLGSTLGFLAGGSVLTALALAPGAVEEAINEEGQLERFDVAMDQVVAMMWGTGAVLVLWSLVSAVLAVLVLRRSSVARGLLAVSAGLTAAFSLLAILSGVAVVTLLLGGATVVLLFTGGANAWFAGRPAPERGSGPRVSGSGPPW